VSVRHSTQRLDAGSQYGEGPPQLPSLVQATHAFVLGSQNGVAPEQLPSAKHWMQYFFGPQ